MRAQKAKDNYIGRSGPRRMNCCEAVAYAFEDVIPFSSDELQKFSGFGGGRAPEGFCGAVYAAQYLLGEKGSSHAAEVAAVFNEFAGSAKCREIKALRKISCVACVEKAAKIVEEN